MTLPGWDVAFEAFDANDVGVRDALGHTDLELPHLELLAEATRRWRGPLAAG